MGTQVALFPVNDLTADAVSVPIRASCQLRVALEIHFSLGHGTFPSAVYLSSLDQVHGAIGQLSPSTKFKPQTAFLVNHCSGKEIPLRVCQLAHSINLTCRKKEAKVCERQVNDSWTQGHCIQP